MGQAVSRPIWASGAPATHEAMHEEEVFAHWLVSEDAIRLRAYFISLETGGKDPAGDWLRAEEEFRAEAGEPSKQVVPFAWSYER